MNGVTAMSAQQQSLVHAQAQPQHPLMADTEVPDVARAMQAAELVRHPDHAARAQARWSDLRAAAERLHAAVRPRFVSTVLVLAVVMAAVAALAGVASHLPWSLH